VARFVAASPRLRVPRTAVLAWLPLVAIGAGALALIVAEFLTLREIRTITAVPAGGRVTGGSHNAYSLAVIGLALLPMGFGAVARHARPAAVACLVLSLAAVVVVLTVDLPHINDPGIFAETYDLAQARPAAGFYVESFGAALALLGSVAALVLAPRQARPERAPRRDRPPPEAWDESTLSPPPPDA
jgi:hypothetical protein